MRMVESVDKGREEEPKLVRPRQRGKESTEGAPTQFVCNYLWLNPSTNHNKERDMSNYPMCAIELVSFVFKCVVVLLLLLFSLLRAFLACLF